LGNRGVGSLNKSRIGMNLVWLKAWGRMAVRRDDLRASAKAALGVFTTVTVLTSDKIHVLGRRDFEAISNSEFSAMRAPDGYFPDSGFLYTSAPNNWQSHNSTCISRLGKMPRNL